MSTPPRLSVVCFTNDPAHRVATSLGLLREVAAEIVVAVDDRVDPDTLAPLQHVADRVIRAEFVPPLEANLAWLHDQATADWVLRVDGDDVVSRALVERLATPGWDQGITHAYVSYRWLWGGPDRMLAQPPWWPDPALRLIRNVPGLVRFPTGAHRPAEVAGEHRFLDEAIYHLDLLAGSEADREAKADRYERDATGLRTDPGWSVNSTYYLPERLVPPPRTVPLPEVDAAAVRAVLQASPTDDRVPARTEAAAPTAIAHVRAAERVPPTPGPGDVELRLIADPPLAAVSGRTYTLTVAVRNLGTTTWRPDVEPAPLVSGRFVDADGHPRADVPESRAPLPGPAAPGDEVLVRLPLAHLPEVGPARLEVGLVTVDEQRHPTTLAVAVDVQHGRTVLVVPPSPEAWGQGEELAVRAVLGTITRALPDVVPVLVGAGDDVVALGGRLGCQVAPGPESLRPGRADRAARDEWRHDLLDDAHRLAIGEPPLDDLHGAVLAPFAAADAVVLLPGDGFAPASGDPTALATVAALTTAAAVTAAVERPLLVEAAQIGPLGRRRDRLGLVRAARAAVRFTVADPLSAEALRDLGAGEEAPPLVAHPATATVALARHTAAGAARAALAAVGVGREPPDGREQPYAVFSLRAGHDDHVQLGLLQAVADALPAGTELVYLPVCAGPLVDDRTVLGADPWAAEHLHVLGALEPFTAAAVVAGAALVAGSRPTLVDLARAAGVPAVAFVADEHDARRLEAHADDPGTAFTADQDPAGAAAATTRLLRSEPVGPTPVWDADGFVAALAAVLPPAPRLA